MSWTVWYIQAILRMAGVEAKDLLTRLLSEPEYELDAAWGLFQSHLVALSALDLPLCCSP
jgi:hypothetical protein